VIATAGLLLVIFALARTKRAHIAPAYPDLTPEAAEAVMPHHEE
jgi:hypothetical protein